MRIGFIGLGLMGGPMAANLVKGGHTVTGYDISPLSLEKLTQAGGKAVNSLAEAAKDADVVFTMLPNGPEVESAVCGPQGLGESMPKGALWVDCSTILPAVTQRVGQWLQERGIRAMDAPVGRTSAEAVTGKLLFMVGGEAADLEQVRPCLECMGDTVLHCGALGAGIATKLINNYMTTTLNVLTAEALTLGESLGLDRDRLLEVLRGTPAGRGHINTTYPAKVLKGDTSPAFMIDLADKDLGLVLEVAASRRIPLFTGAGARQAYSLAKAQNRGRDDWTSMLLALRQLGGMN